jgi:hypothetical protein
MMRDKFVVKYLIYPVNPVKNPSLILNFTTDFMLDFRFLGNINGLIDLKLLEKRVDLKDAFRFDNKEGILPVNLVG